MSQGETWAFLVVFLSHFVSTSCKSWSHPVSGLVLSKCSLDSLTGFWLITVFSANRMLIIDAGYRERLLRQEELCYSKPILSWMEVWNYTTDFVLLLIKSTTGTLALSEAEAGNAKPFYWAVLELAGAWCAGQPVIILKMTDIGEKSSLYN